MRTGGRAIWGRAVDQPALHRSQDKRRPKSLDPIISTYTNAHLSIRVQYTSCTQHVSHAPYIMYKTGTMHQRMSASVCASMFACRITFSRSPQSLKHTHIHTSKLIFARHARANTYSLLQVDYQAEISFDVTLRDIIAAVTAASALRGRVATTAENVCARNSPIYQRRSLEM